MSHEIVAALRREGLEPGKRLLEMLDEHPKHTTERRGCGLTQATRLLADYINRRRAVDDAHDLSMFSGFADGAMTVIASRALEAGWPLGWRELQRAPAVVVDAIGDLRHADELMSLDAKLAQASQTVVFEESRLLLALLRGILSAGTQGGLQLDFMAEKPEVGSCTRAEEYFLELANGQIRRRGYINIFVDTNARPVLVEKMHMGESHSAIVLEPLGIGGVVIPPGGLAALRHVRPDTVPQTTARRWQVLPVSVIAEARFLRLTTLAVAPQNRERAFSAQFKRQLVLNMRGPGVTTMDDLRRFARVRAVAD